MDQPSKEIPDRITLEELELAAELTQGLEDELGYPFRDEMGIYLGRVQQANESPEKVANFRIYLDSLSALRRESGAWAPVVRPLVELSRTFPHNRLYPETALTGSFLPYWFNGLNAGWPYDDFVGVFKKGGLDLNNLKGYLEGLLQTSKDQSAVRAIQELNQTVLESEDALLLLGDSTEVIIYACMLGIASAQEIKEQLDWLTRNKLDLFQLAGNYPEHFGYPIFNTEVRCRELPERKPLTELPADVYYKGFKGF